MGHRPLRLNAWHCQREDSSRWYQCSDHERNDRNHGDSHGDLAGGLSVHCHSAVSQFSVRLERSTRANSPHFVVDHLGVGRCLIELAAEAREVHVAVCLVSAEADHERTALQCVDHARLVGHLGGVAFGRVIYCDQNPFEEVVSCSMCVSRLSPLADRVASSEFTYQTARTRT